MIESPITDQNRKIMIDAFQKVEDALNADVLTFVGEIFDGIEGSVKDIVEQFCIKNTQHDRLAVLLTTNGGSLNPVKRMVNIFRHYYKEVWFIVPDCAYSAGTVWCCSGDKIFMNYYSVLGPIDPQVKNKEGHFVPALGYLDKIDELIKKAQNNTLTDAEFVILKDFDLAELRGYEQARDLAIDLLKEWLAKYKFKDWQIHNSNGKRVTEKDKVTRAEYIAKQLSDNKKWKSHGRPINREELVQLKLQIDNLELYSEMDAAISKYHSIMTDYIQKYNLKQFIQARGFL